MVERPRLRGVHVRAPRVAGGVLPSAGVGLAPDCQLKGNEALVVADVDSIEHGSQNRGIREREREGKAALGCQESQPYPATELVPIQAALREEVAA